MKDTLVEQERGEGLDARRESAAVETTSSLVRCFGHSQEEHFAEALLLHWENVRRPQWAGMVLRTVPSVQESGQGTRWIMPGREGTDSSGSNNVAPCLVPTFDHAVLVGIELCSTDSDRRSL